MLTETPTRQDEELLSYRIASGDMRFIEIGERVLYLCPDQKLGQVIHGEMPECSSENYANLSQILLEYVMSCGDCRQADLADGAAIRFGQQLGQKIIDVCYGETAVSPHIKKLIHTTTIILNSMDVPYQLEQTDTQIQFTLIYCPLHETASKTGLTLWIPLAHRAFVSLIHTFLQQLAPEWTLQLPTDESTEIHELDKIQIRKT